MNFFKRKWIGFRLRRMARFIERELELIKINHPFVPRGVLLEYRYQWLRAAKTELMYPSDWREAWED